MGPGAASGGARSGAFPGTAPASAVSGVKLEVIPAEEIAVEEAEPARREEPSAIARSTEVVQKILGLSGWERNADVRSKWILVPEEKIVHEFGKPDHIWMQESGSENWIYKVPSGKTDEDGNQECEEIGIEIHRGRVVNAWD